MADVRALLAAERQSRRISHPFLTYTKSGQLLCNVCHLNVKSEALWEGHLRSANHRTNAAKAAEEKSTKSLKRKLDEVSESGSDRPVPEDDARKKPKSRAVSGAEESANANGNEVEEDAAPKVSKTVSFQEQIPQDQQAIPDKSASDAQEQEKIDWVKEHPPNDDDEMAAFERDIASLEQQPDYSAATITAAPVSAAELQQQEKEDQRRQKELEAEDEIEEEGRKMEEEFEVMEELESRIKKLKERREALRSVGTGEGKEDIKDIRTENIAGLLAGDTAPANDEDSDDNDEVDEWYG